MNSKLILSSFHPVYTTVTKRRTDGQADGLRGESEREGGRSTTTKNIPATPIE